MPAREVGDVLIALDRAALAAEVLLEDRFDVRVAGNFVPAARHSGPLVGTQHGRPAELKDARNQFSRMLELLVGMLGAAPTRSRCASGPP